MDKDRRIQERFEPPERLDVYDRATGAPVGELANLSVTGAMLVTDGPTPVGTMLRCRVGLPRAIMGRHELLFDAECRWSRKNVAAGRWESGFRLTVTGIDADLISFVTLSFKLRDWGEIEAPEVETVDMANRRAATRYEFDQALPVFERDSYRQVGLVADLSADGMRLISSRPCDKNQILHCKVKLFKTIFRQDYLVLDARCMWSRKEAGGDEYESGFLFVNLSPTDAATISHLLIHYGEPQPTTQRIKIVR